MAKMFIIFLLTTSILQGQTDTSLIDFSAYVHLDSVMVTAKREGFSVDDFIKIIQEDNTLETAFNNLRSVSYQYSNDIRYFRRNGKVIASYESTNQQHYTGACQWMEVLESMQLGNTSKFYTSAFYERVFYQKEGPCSEPSVRSKPNRAHRILESRISELKKLIYTPGQPASIPLVGKKTAIFSKEMIDKYDFTIKSRGNSYVFLASIKPTFNYENPNGSIIKFLEVEMKKGNLQVMKRKYKLQYDAGVYDFDVLMLVELERFNNKYIPSKITYDGYWKVVGKKVEKCKFKFELLEFLSK